MPTTTYTPENLHTLPESLRPVVIEAFHETYYDTISTLSEEDAEVLTDELREVIPGFDRLRYDISYSQGSGASWEGVVLFSDEWRPPYASGVFAALERAEKDYPYIVRALREQCGRTLDELRRIAAEHRLKGWPAPEMAAGFDSDYRYVHEGTITVEPLLEGDHPYEWFYWWLAGDRATAFDEGVNARADALEREYLARVREPIQAFADSVARFIHDYMTKCYESSHTWEWVEDFLLNNDVAVSVDADACEVEFRHL